MVVSKERDGCFQCYQNLPLQKEGNFEEFFVQTTEPRRQGDSDPSLALHANMAKLSVNSVYGKTITNKENHKNVKYSQDPESVSAMIASDRFVSL